MSYEGREINICEKGHLVHDDCTYSFELESCHCGAKIVWHRSIDDTNGESFGDFPIEFFKLKAAPVFEECPTCHNKKILEQATYEIPTCPKCGAYEIASTRHMSDYGADMLFVGSIGCTKCNTILL